MVAMPIVEQFKRFTFERVMFSNYGYVFRKVSEVGSVW